MDLKALIAKMDQIESKTVLTESEDRPAAKKKETTWTDKSGKKHPATKVQGSKSVAADKDADKERKKHDKALDEMNFQSGIARALLKEFNFSEEEEEQDSEETLDEAGNPWEGQDPAKAAAWAKLSPEDQKWIGMADPTDQYILARAPSNGGFLGSIGLGKKTRGGQAASPAAPSGPKATAQTDDEGNTLTTTASGATSVVGPDGKPLPNGGRITPPGGQAASPAPAAVPAGINPETGEKYDDGTNAPLQEPPGAEKPAGGQAASPAAKPGFKADPIGQSIANQLKMTTPDAIKTFQKNQGLTPDGQIGPATTKALQAAAQKMGLTVASGVGTSTAGAGRGGQGGPTASQMAKAPAPAGQAASPAAAPNPVQDPAGYKKYMNDRIMRAQQAKGQPAPDKRTPAEIQASKDLAGAMEESGLDRIRRLAGM